MVSDDVKRRVAPGLLLDLQLLPLHETQRAISSVPIPDASRQKRVFRKCLAIFFLAFVIRGAAVLATHQYRDLQRFELERVALSLAHWGVFGNPYGVPTGPTAHVSPGYPLLLALIFRVFGDGVTGEIVKQLFASACSALVCALMPLAGTRLQLPALARYGAALFAALLPLKLKTETQGDWESPCAALAILFILAHTVKIWRTRNFSGKSAVASGGLWAGSLLFVSALFPLLFALPAAGLVFTTARNRRDYLRYAAITILVAIVGVSPWAVRNWNVLGQPVFGRDNAGIELRVSNNPYAAPNEERNYLNGVYDRYHPLQNITEAAKVRDLGEIAFNRIAMSQAIDWAETNPSRFLRLTLGRIRWYWFPAGRGFLLKAVVLGAYTVLSFAGLYLLFRRDRLAFLAAATVMLVFPLPNYLIHVGLKHRYPIDWLLLLLAAFAVHELYRAYNLRAKIA